MNASRIAIVIFLNRNANEFAPRVQEITKNIKLQNYKKYNYYIKRVLFCFTTTASDTLRKMWVYQIQKDKFRITHFTKSLDPHLRSMFTYTMIKTGKLVNFYAFKI